MSKNENKKCILCRATETTVRRPHGGRPASRGFLTVRKKCILCHDIQQIIIKMKFITIVLLAWMSHLAQASSQVLYTCKNVRITLYSSAPIEDIKASSSTGVSVYNATTGELAFSLSINSFQFEKSLMQEHFNSDYMESDKFPKATFKGKIQEQIDASKDGTYPVTVTGDLTVHGVTQKRTIPGTVTIKNGVITMTSEFMVKCADHRITIPSIVFHNIAEIIKMNVSATYVSNNNTKTK